jgi:hypothetical protein
MPIYHGFSTRGESRLPAVVIFSDNGILARREDDPMHGSNGLKGTDGGGLTRYVKEGSALHAFYPAFVSVSP